MAEEIFNIPTSNVEYLGRKSVNTSGRLGSLYDAFTEKLINQQNVRISQTQRSVGRYASRMFAGSQTAILTDYLKWMNFDDAMRQNILFGLTMPSGVSCLIDYNQFINENTRFLYCSYRSKEEELIATAEKMDHIISSTQVTHMITKILWGFEILCVIQITDQQYAVQIDGVLQSISNQLENYGGIYNVPDNVKHFISNLNNVIVYGSETCIDTRNTPLLNVLTTLEQWRNNENFHHPLIYTLCPLRSIYTMEQLPEFTESLDQTNPNSQHIYYFICNINVWKIHLKNLFDRFPSKFFNDTFNHRMEELKWKFSCFWKAYQEFQNDCQTILIGVRQKRRQLSEILNLLSEQRYSLLNTAYLQNFSHYVYEWYREATLLEKLSKDQIRYIRVSDLDHHETTPVTLPYIEERLQRFLLEKYDCCSVFYANEYLKNKEPVVWEGLYQELISKRQETAEKSNLFYADFTNCQCNLTDLIIVALTMTTSVQPPLNHQTVKLDTPIPLSNPPPLPCPQTAPSPPSITEINVLLLGETGVGKSTFINAFVNYLIFDTLQQAEQNESVVLIPVSFLTTVGDQFEEVTVKFGDVDSNENHEHQGQSVTQQCKSYVFHLNEKLVLRLIDTPGIGDTRGVAQDDKNMDHILSYVNNLSHLNAVCLLLKPNASRLNVFFRSCINQLFAYLTPNSYNNIIFCFTNARATFFAPGDTGSLLRQMLKNEYQNNIPFEKTNTFCFDSESFRYLAARKCGVNFDDFQKQECGNSWTTSVKESVRLLEYILKRKPYRLDENQSPRKIALEISMLARPLMETLRLTVYNWALCDTGAVMNQIKLISEPVNIDLCSNCALSELIQVGSLPLMAYKWIRPEANTVQSHQCTLDGTDFLIEYTVKYHLTNESPSPKKEIFGTFIVDVLLKCDKLTHFLQQQKVLAQDDPFAPILERFLNEEDQILCINQTNLIVNKKVRDVLTSGKEQCKKNNLLLNESVEKLSVDEICRIIKELKSYDSIGKTDC